MWATKGVREFYRRYQTRFEAVVPRMMLRSRPRKKLARTASKVEDDGEIDSVDDGYPLKKHQRISKSSADPSISSGPSEILAPIQPSATSAVVAVANPHLPQNHTHRSEVSEVSENLQAVLDTDVDEDRSDHKSDNASIDSNETFRPSTTTEKVAIPKNAKSEFIFGQPAFCTVQSWMFIHRQTDR